MSNIDQSVLENIAFEALSKAGSVQIFDAQNLSTQVTKKERWKETFIIGFALFALLVSDSLSMSDSVSLELKATSVDVVTSDDNSANWGDAVALDNHIAWSAPEDLNSWSDTTTQFMTKRLQIVDDNSENLLDAFKINEFQTFSDDLNSWLDELLLDRFAVLSLSDTNTMSDSYSSSAASGHLTCSDSFTLSDGITLMVEKRLNILDTNSTNWNNLFGYLKS